MAQSNFEEEITSQNNTAIDFINVMTGDKDRQKQLYFQLKNSIDKAKRIDIIVSFLMESGVRLLLKDLRKAVDKNVPIRILTGNYLNITQPSALYLIKQELNNKVDLRFYNNNTCSFHPKAYFFHYDDYGEIYIGSSNISKSALTSGIEWNYRFNDLLDKDSFQKFFMTFEDLFYNHSIIVTDEELYRYSKYWRKPAVIKDLEKYKTQDTNIIPLIQPRGVQIEALYALNNSRNEGATKALVHAATGIGKTYLSAFDSANYKRILFVAHREEILKQAVEAFKNVRKSDDYGFFDGKQKDKDKSMIFASVMTLAKDEYLNEAYFPRDYFEYIIIDEFHHAVNNQYKKIVDYFKPKFLLGLTATPERLDGKNIYELCDYNVPYEITLKEAINKGILVPFHYYGIYDETDYSNLHLVKGKYSEEELTSIYKGNKQRFDLIYKYYQKYHSKQALGFCCSKQHAEMMAKDFNKRGIAYVAVYSNADGEYAMNRQEAINKLKQGQIKVIFSVDMFNEGLDIPSVDMVMFLRPTQSPIVFLQQLGRGLRTYQGKRYLNVLDFIGNYVKAGKFISLLTGTTTERKRAYVYQEEDLPDECILDFDMQLVDLFKRLDMKVLSMKEKIINEYFRIKELLDNKKPTRVELFTYMEDSIYQYCMSHAKENPFRHYLDFLNDLNELSDDEKALYKTIGKDFINLIETTDMQKVYKMPILYAFYNQGNIKLAITDEDVLYTWKAFFNKNKNWKDFADDMTYDKYLKITDKKHLTKAKTMPIKYLKTSGKGFFVEKEGFALALNENMKEIITNKAFVDNMRDVLEYRTIEYYRRRYNMNNF